MGVLILLSVILAVSYVSIVTHISMTSLTHMQVVGSAVYNLWFHPLATQPGPFFARISGIPSFYHACKGDRHIWSWRQFQIYGERKHRYRFSSPAY
jgi:hypothetical protein